MALPSTDPSDIANAARCFSSCISDPLSVRAYLLDQVSIIAAPPCVTPTAPTLAGLVNGGGDPAFDGCLQASWKQLSNSGTLIIGYIVSWGTTSGGPYTSNSGLLPVTPKTYLACGLTPGTTYFFVVQAVGSVSGCNSVNSNERSNVPTGTSPLSPATLDWVARVQINGDPKPPDPIITCYDNWYKALVAGGIDGKIICNCLLNAVPGTLITNVTPFFKVKGSDPWAHPALGGANFGANGLSGIAGAGFLATGMVPATDYPSANNCGIAAYYYDNPGTNTGFEGGITNGAFTQIQEIYYNGPGSGYFFTMFFGGGDSIHWDPGGALSVFNGWKSSQRTAANAWSVYAANSVTPHASVGSSVNAPGAIPPGLDIYFKSRNDNGAGDISLPGTISFAIITQGLTAAEDTILFNATQTLLQCAGGGFR